MALPYHVTAGCWAIFLVVWIASAFFVKQNVERPSSAKSRLIRFALAGTFLLLLRSGLELRLPAQAPSLWQSSAGEMVCVAGLLLALWARAWLGRNWSASVTFQQEHELICTGPYALVRHPIYTAVLMMVFGTALVVDRREGAFVFVFVALGLWIKSRAEERLMAAHFPQEYPAYRARTKALIPFVI